MATEGSAWSHHNRTNTVTHSKEDALDERQFEFLLEGAAEMKGYRQTEAEFIILVAGRLGLRGGEITHLQENWLNWREQRIEVPAHVDCTKGKDGGQCGYCSQMIDQSVRVNDVDRSDVAPNWWRPKTEAAVRGVPFDWSPRAEITLERFFDEFDQFERSHTAISRRVKTAAENAPELEPSEIYPHCLRASAATHQAGKGLSAHALCSMFGWVSLSTARVYIARSDDNTQRAVRSAHSQ